MKKPTPIRKRFFDTAIKRPSHIIICFIVSWLAFTLFYGDVFQMARSSSFFAFNRVLMSPVAEKPGGLVWLAGRMLLCLFAKRWLGGLIMALMFTSGAWFFGQLLRLSPRWAFLQYLPFNAWFAYLVWLGFDAYIYAEPGKMLGVPFVFWLVIGILYALVRIFKPANRQTEPLSAYITSSGTTVLLLGLVWVYGMYLRPYVLATARLQKLLQNERYEEMIETAEAYNGSNRQVAAYHAIALHHTGGLLDGLFQIRYDFEPIKLTNWYGKPSLGTAIYSAELDFHAGLLQTAYRKDMERIVFDGLSTSRLKRMICCAVLRNETNLALRYLHVLAQQPFERAFVRRLYAMAVNPDLIRNDATLLFIRRLVPAQDTFESYLPEPSYIGYYISLQKARNKVQRDACTAAALYTKNLPLFVYRAKEHVAQKPLPLSVGDGLGLSYVQGIIPKDNAAGLEPYAARAQMFLNEAGKEAIQNGEDKNRNLFNKYRGSYLYYYYFGNRPSDEPVSTEETSKGGIN